MINELVILEARKRIGLLIKDLRNAKGFSQTYLAEEIGVTMKTINKIESGRFNFGIDILLKLSVVFELTFNFEIKEESDPNRFLFQNSKEEGKYVVTDIKKGIVCTFEHGKFVETQNLTFLSDSNVSASKMATIMRELGDFLVQNYSEIL